MTYQRRPDGDPLCHLAAVVREIPLETVLRLRGAERDPCDRSRWRTERGPITVTGVKFINWHTGVGGGGAIDLVMHLAEVRYRVAVAWLAQHSGCELSSPCGPKSAVDVAPSSESDNTLALPADDSAHWDRVCRYLTGARHLPISLVTSLHEAGRLYADARGNAVFVMMAGRPNRPVGAELRGTGSHLWRGMARGTRKDSGFFWVGAIDCQTLVICESAIDAMSCSVLHGDALCISTAGVRSRPRWLPSLIARGYTIFCGFDADEAGDDAARQMMASYPTIQRLRPSVKDWNDVLATTR